ncbi:MAG: hypothetical protein U5K75_11365 [Ahrensia sp.]|nr:hypothetical protein [Ahrensia sp.]
MTTTVFLAVLFAAVLHAVWNALLKHGDDKFLGMTGVMIGHTPLAIAAAAYCPLPEPASYPYIIASMVLHLGYQMFLLTSYRFGDLTQVYPIARGTAPLIVAGASIAFLGITLLPMEIAGVLVIGLGLVSLSFVRHNSGARNAKAALLALITGCFIASYSLNDGLGARVAGTSFVILCLGDPWQCCLVFNGHASVETWHTYAHGNAARGARKAGADRAEQHRFCGLSPLFFFFFFARARTRALCP